MNRLLQSSSLSASSSSTTPSTASSSNNMDNHQNSNVNGNTIGGVVASLSYTHEIQTTLTIFEIMGFVFMMTCISFQLTRLYVLNRIKKHRSRDRKSLHQTSSFQVSRRDEHLIEQNM
jgi:hypothetical protein